MSNNLPLQRSALSAAAGEAVPRVLVTVAQVAGSGPREPGAKMLVTAQHAFDTIGGGHLELRAIEIAREMLAAAPGELQHERRYERFPLGPSLGQCCGGVVFLAFERIPAQPGGLSATHFLALAQRWREGQASWRMLPLDVLEAPSSYDASGVLLSGPGPARLALPGPGVDCKLRVDEQGRRSLVDAIQPHRHTLYIFGAGHVGAAIVRALGELPCYVVWVDERDDLFPDILPANARIEATDTPQAVVDQAPAGSSFLVLTYSHALDLQLSEHILRRRDVTWFGLIGSSTKRVSFERRLQERGIAAGRMADMTCPIGLPGITGKAPAVIAVSVAAQLMQVWERANARLASAPVAATMEDAAHRSATAQHTTCKV
jgi:xanthine dehydrogenase accessory factor